MPSHSEPASSDTRVFYRDIKPYEAPGSLSELRGPRVGIMVLPINVYWGPESAVNLDSEGGVVKAYQATLSEGRVIDQEALLNRDLLIEIWPRLLLPMRVRALWEERFSELTAAA
jgi:hypothetical protein